MVVNMVVPMLLFYLSLILMHEVDMFGSLGDLIGSDKNESSPVIYIPLCCLAGLPTGHGWSSLERSTLFRWWSEEE